MINNKVIVIVGPTASGKSSLGIEVAKRTNGVVISADSMQIYKELDIGTAKVTEKEAQGIKHELIDICEITDNFDVSQYKEMCYEKIHEVLAQGKTPIIVGGTGLYINAVVNNVEFGNIDKEQEEKADKLLAEIEKDKTTEELYEYLKSCDIEGSQLVDKSNRRRVLRAIKLHLLGTSRADNKSDLWKDNGSKYNFLVVYIDIPRDLLYDRINLRVDEMVKNGVLDEARRLYDVRVKSISTVFQAIGYKEFFEFFDGTKSLEDCIELLKLNTRHYAKRQVTWFKKLENKLVVNGIQSKNELVEQILREYYGN